MLYKVTDVEKVIPNQDFDRSVMIGHILSVTKNPIVGQRFECYDDTASVWFYSSEVKDIIVDNGVMTLVTNHTRYTMNEKF